MLQFDSLAFANALTDGGMDRRVAETVAAAQHELFSEMAAKSLLTRDDIDDLRILIETRMVALTAASERVIYELRGDLDALRSAYSESFAEVKAANAAMLETINRMQSELPGSLREPLLHGQKQELVKLREAVFEKMQVHQDRRDHSTFLMIRAIRNKLLLLGIVAGSGLIAAGFFAMRHLSP